MIVGILGAIVLFASALKVSPILPTVVSDATLGGKSKGKRPFHGKQGKKGNMPLKALKLGKVWPRSRRLRPIETRV